MSVLVVLAEGNLAGPTLDRLAARGTRFTEAFVSTIEPWEERLRNASIASALLPSRALADWIAGTNQQTHWALTTRIPAHDTFDAMLWSILDALERSGRAASTLVVVAGESTRTGPIEPSRSRTTLVLAGPSVPVNRVCRTPVSLADIYRTVLYAVRLPLTTQLLLPISRPPRP